VDQTLGNKRPSAEVSTSDSNEDVDISLNIFIIENIITFSLLSGIDDIYRL
jgi:hypothetical protein